MSSKPKSAFLAEISEAYISIVVPVFNEAPNIVKNLDLLISEIEPYFSKFEVIVISDGSRDGTNVEMFRFQYPGIKFKIFPKNMGKGAVVRSGFEMASGDYIFFIDGGMELHPRELRIFLGLMFIYEADIVIASKRHPQSEIQYPLIRRILSSLYQKMIQMMFDIDVTDTQVGLKLFRREVVQSILPLLEIDRYGFDLEILSLARLKGYRKMLEAPIRMDYFGRNQRFFLKEWLHVFKVGFSLFKDTIRLYRKVRRLQKEADFQTKATAETKTSST